MLARLALIGSRPPLPAASYINDFTFLAENAQRYAQKLNLAEAVRVGRVCGPSAHSPAHMRCNVIPCPSFSLHALSACTSSPLLQPCSSAWHRCDTPRDGAAAPWGAYPPPPSPLAWRC